MNGRTKRCELPKKNLVVLTPPAESYTGVSAGRTRETWDQPDALGMPVARRRPIGQNSDSSTVVAQNQDSYKRSKCKTLQRCQFCQKQFKYASRLRDRERVHTGDRPFPLYAGGLSLCQAVYVFINVLTPENDHSSVMYAGNLSLRQAMYFIYLFIYLFIYSTSPGPSEDCQ